MLGILSCSVPVRHAGGLRGRGTARIEPSSIAARAAEMADAMVIASIDVTDQSMGRGRSFCDHEYSRRSWVRFAPEQGARATQYAGD